MSYYVETNLTKNETVVCKAFVNKTALVPMILIAAVCLAIIFILNATVVATIYEAIKNSDSTTPDFVYAVFCVLFCSSILAASAKARIPKVFSVPLLSVPS